MDSGSCPNVVATPSGFSMFAVTPSWCMKVVTCAPPTRPYVHSAGRFRDCRSEEHTSELQSHLNLVCRLLLEKKKKSRQTNHHKLYITASSQPLRSSKL